MRRLNINCHFRLLPLRMLGLVFQERRKSPDMLQQHTARSGHSLLSQRSLLSPDQLLVCSPRLERTDQGRASAAEEGTVAASEDRRAPRPEIRCLSTDWPPCRGICLPKWQLRTNLVFTRVIPLVLILVFFFPFNTQKSSPGTALVAQ